MASGTPENFLSLRQWKIRAVEQLEDIFPTTGEVFEVRHSGSVYQFAPVDPTEWRSGFNPVPIVYVPGDALTTLPSESPGSAGFDAAVKGKEYFYGTLTLHDAASGQDVNHTLWLWVVTDYKGPGETVPHSLQIAYVSPKGPGLNPAGHVHADD
jgi:hypothetical protein